MNKQRRPERRKVDPPKSQNISSHPCTSLRDKLSPGKKTHSVVLRQNGKPTPRLLV